jgi:hypothetical protein
MEHAAMPVGPIHHRRYAKFEAFEISHVSIFSTI